MHNPLRRPHPPTTTGPTAPVMPPNTPTAVLLATVADRLSDIATERAVRITELEAQVARLTEQASAPAEVAPADAAPVGADVLLQVIGNLLLGGVPGPSPARGRRTTVFLPDLRYDVRVERATSYLYAPPETTPYDVTARRVG